MRALVNLRIEYISTLMQASHNNQHQQDEAFFHSQHTFEKQLLDFITMPE
jgi:hypothetical protein